VPSSSLSGIHAEFALFLSFNNPARRISPPLVGIHGCRFSGAAVIADDCSKLNIKITSYSRTSAVGNYKISLRAHWGSLNAFAISYRRPQKVSIDRSVAGIKESHLKARAGAIGDAEVVAAVHVLSHDMPMLGRLVLTPPSVVVPVKKALSNVTVKVPAPLATGPALCSCRRWKVAS
jgi:hypothetical protein